MTLLFKFRSREAQDKWTRTGGRVYTLFFDNLFPAEESNSPGNFLPCISVTQGKREILPEARGNLWKLGKMGTAYA
jgi:hypothetical protein